MATLPKIMRNVSPNLLFAIIGFGYLVAGPFPILMLVKPSRDCEESQSEKPKDNRKHDKGLSDVFTPMEPVRRKQAQQ